MYNAFLAEMEKVAGSVGAAIDTQRKNRFMARLIPRQVQRNHAARALKSARGESASLGRFTRNMMANRSIEL